MSVVIGIEPKAEPTKGSFVVYAESVTEDVGRSRAKYCSPSQWKVAEESYPNTNFFAVT
jgi:hypothetical protein